ncbi:AbrB/MazE/SpoVT family DNA-binding domain-containing protein [Candidatus Nomurabacteria bacterium]|nr:AbrB/MazE/SpoVT family DNA-binding domain-containing protein [Candidatus Nomurabacteria bacterium]
MTTKIQKWGNSLAVRIPKVFTQNLNWKEGTSIHFEQIGNALVISSSHSKYTLEKLIKGITKRNRHKSLWPNDKPRGKEIW